MDSLPVGYCSSLIWTGCIIELSNVLVASSMRYEIIFLPVYSCFSSGTSHLLSATVRVYSLVAPCRLPDLTPLALLGSVSGQPGLSRGPLPGYKRVSKWRLQLQDSTPFLLLSQRFCTILHTSASLGCYLLFTHMPLSPGTSWSSDSSNICFVRL